MRQYETERHSHRDTERSSKTERPSDTLRDKGAHSDIERQIVIERSGDKYGTDFSFHIFSFIMHQLNDIGLS